MPVVHANDAEDPAGRGAHRAGFDDRLKEDGGIELEPLPALRLQAAEEAGLLEIRKGLVGQAAQLFGAPHALLDRREQGTHASEIFFGRHGPVPFRAFIKQQPKC